MTVLCECGCGQPAPIAQKTNACFGHVKGQPIRFVRGHQCRRHGHAAVANRCGAVTSMFGHPSEEECQIARDRGLDDPEWVGA